MSKRLLFSVIVLATLSMLLFVAGFACWKLGLGWLGGLLYWLAGKVMLLAFSLLVLLAMLAALAAFWGELRGYFSSEARVLRRLLSLRSRSLDARHYMLAQSRQLRFWNAFKRRLALQANNRKHLRSLFRAIDADLQQAKAYLPRAQYRQLHKALRQYHRQADVAAMLTLREQLPCR